MDSVSVCTTGSCPERSSSILGLPICAIKSGRKRNQYQKEIEKIILNVLLTLRAEGEEAEKIVSEVLLILRAEVERPGG